MQPIHPEPVREVMPEGMLPFESTVIRAMRRAKLRAADHERARIVAWVRQQKAAAWPDLRDLATAIKQGEHHMRRQGGNVYVMEPSDGVQVPKSAD